MPKTWLGVLNFFVLQWFCVRLARITERRPTPDDLAGAMMVRLGWISRDQYLCREVTIGWTWLRWIWPLTGWWSDYRYVARRR